MRAASFALVLALAACSKKDAPPAAAEPKAVEGKVRVTADDKGFTPSSMKAAKGKPLTLEFVRTSADTCADKVVFPEINVSKDLPMNTPVTVEVPTDAARTLVFQCGMGMFKSSVVVSGS